MKKIVALALCLVLALSLCATAFAYNTDDEFDLYEANSDNMKDSSNVKSDATKEENGVKMVTTSATTASNGSGTIEYMTFTGATTATGKFVKTAKPLADDYAVTEKGKTTVLFYVTEVTETAYDFTAKEFKNFGLSCGQINKSANNDKDYYVTSDGTVYEGAAAGAHKALVDGSVELVDETATTYTKGDVDKVLKHKYYMTSSKADGTKIVPTAVACQNCGDKSTELYKDRKLPAGKTNKYTIDVSGTIYYVIPSGTGSTGTTSGSKVDSAKTFDAGIALYVGMSISAVAGSAVVIGKKKEF